MQNKELPTIEKNIVHQDYSSGHTAFVGIFFADMQEAKSASELLKMGYNSRNISERRCIAKINRDLDSALQSIRAHDFLCRNKKEMGE